MGQNKQLIFKIVTPERVVFEGVVDSVSLMTQMGEITVLPEHIPLVGLVQAGEVRVRHGAQESYLFTSGGYVQIRPGNEVVVLADASERVEEIDVKRAEAARARAQKLLQEKQFKNDIEFAALQSALERSLIRIRVVQRRRSSH